MNFKDEINNYNDKENTDMYLTKEGKIPVILTAVHTMRQQKENGLKKSEPFTKEIAQYVADKVNCSYYIKLKDNGIDSNSNIIDEFKESLLAVIKKDNVKLLIDIHGAGIDRDFDVEFGTLNNLSADFSVIKELEEAFNKYGINNIKYNDPFKGGGITQYIYSNTDIDVIQIEINKKFRDNDGNMEKLCYAIISFINYYYEKTK